MTLQSSYDLTEAEEILFPFLFKTEKVDIHSLVFAITPGEPLISPFQAANMDYSHQLQFIGLDKNRLLAEDGSDIEALAQQVFLARATLPICWNVLKRQFG